MDAEIAVLLRLTGHSRHNIVQAIELGAAGDRPNERHDWKAYAERTTAFAFGRASKQPAERLKMELDRLLSVEGRRRHEIDLLQPGRPLSRFRF
jgi:hypothetical protein